MLPTMRDDGSSRAPGGGSLRVRDWMTAQPVTVTPSTSVLNARRLLHLHGVRHLPVVDCGHVVGMLSDRDLLLGDSQIVLALSALQSDLVGGRYRRVDTIMSTPAHVVGADDPVRLAAERMQQWRVNSLPVIDGGQLVGIITSTDCMRALLRLLDDDAQRALAPPQRPNRLEAGSAAG